MPKRALVDTTCRVWFSTLLLISTCYSLKCRTDDGPSEAELKRITRNCMRKIGENLHSSNGGAMRSAGNNKHYGPLHQSNFGAQYGGNSRYDYKNYYDYDDDDGGGGGGGERYNGNSNNNKNNNYNNGNYDHENGNRNVLQQRNRERQQNNRSDNNNRSATSPGINDNGGRYDNGRSNGNGNGGGRGGGGSGGGNGGFNNGNRSSNNNGRNSGNSSNGGGGSSNNQRGHSQNNSNNNNNNNNNHNQNANNDTADAACVVHCFFEELNMLNTDDYPDRYKVQYGLTRELRDRQLRNFYTDTIQDCFHYLESQRRRDKCHYSRDLISCMSEYAKVNCDDWQEFSLVFN